MPVVRPHLTINDRINILQRIGFLANKLANQIEDSADERFGCGYLRGEKY